MTSQAWAIDPAQAQAALDLLRQSSFVLMPTHQNVDADGLASPLALLHALDWLGCNGAVLISDGQLPHNLEFLPGMDRVLIYGRDPLPEYDLLCLVDCADQKRLGTFYQDDPSRVSGVVPILNIDHHVTNQHFGTVNIVEPDAASTAELVAELLKLWRVPMTMKIAECLLTGIYGDTLGLRTEATTSRTMRTAADLVDAGANPALITDYLFRLKPQSTVCLWERVLRNTRWTGSLIWTEVTPEILAECNAKPSEAEGIVNFLAGTEGSRAAAILYAGENGWRASMRTLHADVDLAAIASEFGGGGHPRAAGCQITGGEEAKQAFLEEVARLADLSWVERTRE
ncbi:MAG TPA: bifunctional oligoribonuclease/PAP phosphatase NrnA [Thermomicrobiales bacterium]